MILKRKKSRNIYSMVNCKILQFIRISKTCPKDKNVVVVWNLNERTAMQSARVQFQLCAPGEGRLAFRTDVRLGYGSWVGWRLTFRFLRKKEQASVITREKVRSESPVRRKLLPQTVIHFYTNFKYFGPLVVQIEAVMLGIHPNGLTSFSPTC